MKSVLAVLLLVFIFLVPVTAVKAMEYKTGDTVYFSQNEKSPGSLAAFGNSVDISGAVNGDLWCAGQTVTVKGDVTGDVICAGQTVTIDGSVGGNIRVAGQQVLLNGLVSRNVSVLGQNLSVSGAGIEGELVTAVSNLNLTGSVGQGIFGVADKAELNGQVEGDINLNLTSLTIGSSASISGNIRYESNLTAIIEPGAKISGMVTRQSQSVPSPKANQPQIVRSFSSDLWSGRRIFLIFTWIGLGLLLASLFPTGLKKVLIPLSTRPGISLGVGFLGTILVPVIMLVLILTLIGIPIAVALAFIWILILVFSRIFVGILVGMKILESVYPAWKDSLIKSAVCGITLTWFAFYLPFIGGIVSLLAMFWGAGALILSLRKDKK